MAETEDQLEAAGDKLVRPHSHTHIDAYIDRYRYVQTYTRSTQRGEVALYIHGI